MDTKEPFVATAYLDAVAVSGPTRGLHTSALVVGVFSSETSAIPDFVLYSLIAGIVCPNCRGHIVPIIALYFPVAIH
jgi:hypothetical protein